jgi:hypothetical protein
MRSSDPDRFNKKRCRKKATRRRMSRCLQVRTLQAKHCALQEYADIDQCDLHDAVPYHALQSFDRLSAWRHREDPWTMTVLTQVVAQYLRGDPLWDGPRTIGMMRNIVSRVI